MQITTKRKIISSLLILFMVFSSIYFLIDTTVINKWFKDNGFFWYDTTHLKLSGTYDDYVDTTSDLHAPSDVGTHSSFSDTQSAPDSVFDLLTEANLGMAGTSYFDFVDQQSDLHSPSDIGSHTSFAEMQDEDEVYDTLQEADTGAGTTNYYDFVDQVSNLHDPTDIGTHSSFAEEQDADEVYDTLTETNKGATGATLYVDSCDASGSWTRTGTTPYLNAADYSTNYIYSSSTGAISSWFGFADNSLFGPLFNVDMQLYHRCVTDSYVYYEFDYTGDGVADATGEYGSYTNWNWYISITLYGLTDAEVDALQVRFTLKKGTGGPELIEIDAARITIAQSPIYRYEIDLEVGWTDAPYSETYEELCIYGGTQDDEALMVDIWTGTWTNIIADLQAGWNNVSVSSYLTSSTLEIRFKGSSESSDTTQSSWQVDGVHLHCWSGGGTNYDLDLEVGWTSVEYSETNEELCIYGGTQGAEALRVDVWSGSWVNVITDLQAGWNNVSVTSYLTSSTFEIRFTDTSDEATLQDSWEVDAVILHTWTVGTTDYELDLEVGWTSISNYNEANEELCIYTGTQDAEALKVDIWDGSWINVIADLQADQWNNVSIASYLDSGTFEIRFVDNDKSDESTQSSWQIDSILIHTWTESNPPTWDTLSESADPLEFGLTETIQINVYDESTIEHVYLEYDSSNHSMSNIGGDTWQWNTWTPTSVGVKPYKIWMIDEYGNTADTSGDITVQDTTDPVISNIGESADPLELGQTETIQCDVTDESTFNYIYLEFEGSNHSMNYVSGNTYQYTTWQPSSTGNYPYIIWAEDAEGNIGSDNTGSITVQDTTDPVIDNVQESADPLELGATETIECDVTELSLPLAYVYLEFDGSNHSMSLKSGITYEYTTWEPTSVGLKDYTIWAEDDEGNIGYYDGSITVQDTSDPVINNVQESADPIELGLTESIQCDVTDESTLSYVYLEFEGSNHTMNYVSGITWQYTTWTPGSAGNYPYTIWSEDNEGNIGYYEGSITVQDTTNPQITDVIESADPLELGNIETITCTITDYSTMYFVYLEFEGSNHTMSDIGGGDWQYSTWEPTSVGVKNYRIWANDTEGNINYYDGSITVQDTTDPVINNVQESADPLELGAIESIQCDITDESTMYFVYLEFEGSNHTMSFVSGITWEYTSWEPASVGNFPYKIWANDTEGNINYYDGSIDVQDTTDPVIDNVQESADPLELGGTETIQCDITDESTMYFVYLEFDGSNHTMSFVSGITWEYTSWTPSTVGNKPYTIWANDTEGNIAYYDGSITVEDTTNPVIDNVQESADPLELGSTETIQCDITDYSTMYFVYLEFDGSNHTMSFVSGITWEYTTWTPTSVGLKSYKIWANDTSGNINSYSSDITVQDTTDPTIDNVQESADPLELGATETIQCDVDDESTLSYVYLEFDGSNHSMSFVSGITWEYTTWTPTSVGNKPYKIWSEDNEGNIGLYNGDITVQDTTDPVISNQQESADPLELGNNETISCDITDESSLAYVYLEFSGSNHTMTNTEGNTWSYSNWLPTTVGLKSYIIWVEDVEGNINSYSSNITVQDTTDPSITNQQESADPLELGQTETITCNITDYSSLLYVYLEYDGSNHTMNNIVGDTWQYSTWTPTSVGLKSYIIWTEDAEGNIASYNSNITVQDTTDPYIDAVQESADPIELGQTETITCNVSDYSTLSYVYLEFDGSNHSMSFVSGITWEYTTWQPTSIGNKPYTIWAEDDEGNIGYYDGDITVQDTNYPQWSDLIESADPLELGLNETITINATDISGIAYVYLEYDSTNHSMTNIYGNTWQYTNWLPTSIGNKPYTIWIEDNSGLINTTSGSIDVQDTIAPHWSDLIESADPLPLGNNETITINCTDVSGIYQVLLEFEGNNHTMTNIYGNTWSYWNWQPASTGNYPYTVWIEDNNGLINSTSGDIDVTEDDINPPTWDTLIESDDPLELGNNETITINVYDPNLYEVLLEYDGTNHSMSNIGGDTFQYTNWQPSSLGIKDYIIWMVDSFNNINSTSGSITVQDTTPPTYDTLIESDDPLELGQNETISINAYDIAGIELIYLEYDGYNWTMNYISGNTWSYSNWQPSSVGIKDYEIWIKDNNGNWNSTSGSITVQDTTPPQWSDLIESDDPLELGNNETISIDATDIAGIELIYLEFDGSNHTMIYISGDTWSYSNWQPSSVGVKDYELWIKDNNGNWNSTSGSITVQDTIAPQWSDLLESDDPLELGNNETITITVSDISGINQVLLEFDGTNHTMNDLGGGDWQYTNWLPSSVGIKDYEVWIEDNNNNWNSTSGTITVQDTIKPTWDTLIESDDPLELGLNETISINAYDISGINQILLEFDGTNHSMSFLSGDTWQYTNWLPTSIGLKDYEIWIEDNNNNWNSTSGDITVQDTVMPQWSNLIESDDPLELGLNETISINATDIAGIELIYLEFDGSNHTMINTIGDTWSYSNWQPSSVGVKPYELWIKDYSGNWNSTSGDITVQDTTPPTWDTLIESDDPLEFGENETISINAYDLSGINQVLLEYDGANYTMNFVSGDTWSYWNWQPSIVGNHPYEIWIEDGEGLWNSTSGSIDVVDTTPPQWSNLIESADPLELGLNETISINVTDISGINYVYLEYDSTNHTMINTIGDTWEYDDWQPSSVGIKNYIIWIEDGEGNINSTSGSITVQDTTPPSSSDLIESADPLELGEYEIITINATDLSGITTVYLEYDNFNHSMTNIYGNTWRYTDWLPTTIGIKNYEIHIKDGNNNWNSTVSGSITVQDTVDPQWSNLIESDDPLELGDTETITITATDIAGIELVYLEFDSSNHSMTYIGSNQWRYNTWTPTSIGIKDYEIHVKDNSGNWNSTSGSITVQDTDDPDWSNLLESDDPLQLGNNESISIIVTDEAGIFEVLLEFEGTNHTMSNPSGNLWIYTAWQPSSEGLYNYTVWMEDNNGLISYVEGNITVSSIVDTIAPRWNSLREVSDPAELGTYIFFFINATDDESGIDFVLLQINGVNLTMSYVSGDMYSYAWFTWHTGVFIYFIWIYDNADNYNNTSGTVSVVIDITPPDCDLDLSDDYVPTNTQITITLNAHDVSGIKLVIMFINDTSYIMQCCAYEEWIYLWTPTYKGDYEIFITVYDNYDNTANLTATIEVYAPIVEPTEPDLFAPIKWLLIFVVIVLAISSLVLVSIESKKLNRKIKRFKAKVRYKLTNNKLIVYIKQKIYLAKRKRKKKKYLKERKQRLEEKRRNEDNLFR